MERIDQSLPERVAQLEGIIFDIFGNVNSMKQSNRILQTTATTINDGDVSFMLISTVLVIFMTLPGLCLYYSGMTREKNILSGVMQIITVTCLVSVLWLICGYSLAFSPVNNFGVKDVSNYLYGGAERLWLEGMTLDTTHQLAETIPESVFCLYELAFAIITTALLLGSMADRMRYGPLFIVIPLWLLIVYCPIAHSNWHPDGWLYQLGVLDFAGGNVVHINAGMSGLAAIFVVGNRIGFGVERFDPHNILSTFTGMAMLWVGWFGFNGGSAFKANNIAGNAILATQICTSISALMWMLTEWSIRKRPSILGMINGSIAGLVLITPGCGFVNMTGAFFIGFLGGPLCYFGSTLKHRLKIDDALDAFGIHGISGAIGGILVGFFATKEIGPENGILYSGNSTAGAHQLAIQIVGILFSGGWAFVFSYIIFKVIDLSIGLRVPSEFEEKGLDINIHDESNTSTHHVDKSNTSSHYSHHPCHVDKVDLNSPPKPRRIVRVPGVAGVPGVSFKHEDEFKELDEDEFKTNLSPIVEEGESTKT